MNPKFASWASVALLASLTSACTADTDLISEIIDGIECGLGIDCSQDTSDKLEEEILSPIPLHKAN